MENKKQTERNSILYKKVCDIQPEKTREYNEMGFSQIYSELFSDELVYNVTAKNWFFYDGIRWREDVGGVQAAEKAKEMYRLLKSYGSRLDEKQGEAFLKYVLSYGNLHKRETLVKDARSLMAKTQEDFDCKHNLFNCLNCTLDLDSMESHEHRASDMLSKVSGCNYNPAADGTKWSKFIDEVMQEDKEKSRYLQRICGYFLTAQTTLEAAFMLYGATTRNGKSTFAETFRNMMGDYAAAIPPETLAMSKNRNSDGASPQIARLAGVRFLNISEPPKRMLLDVALFKSLTGGETISARKLYQEPFEYLPQFKICINCNSLPVVTDDTLFQSERVRIITFDRHFEPQEQNKHLKQELQAAEVLSSVLNWALDGLREFKKNGEQPPKCVLASTDTYKLQSDKIRRFFDDCMEQAAGTNTSGADAHRAYCGWCNDNGYAAEGKSVFFSTLRDRGLMQKRGTVAGKTVSNVIAGYAILDDV